MEYKKMATPWREGLMGFSMAAEKSSDKKDSLKEDRRSNVERRRFSYTEYIPERRSDRDRRKDEEAKTEKDQNREWPDFTIFYPYK